ncbi:MAG: hypothetical protein ACOX3Q_10560 [Clostridia bacterium]
MLVTSETGLSKHYVAKAPKATALLDEAFDDITAVLALPLKVS